MTEDIHETYERDGLGPAMAKFIAFTSVRGPTPPDFPDHAPNPADFGLPTEDDGSRDHPLLGPHMVYVTRYEPDFDSLRAASTRIVVAGGAESEGTFPYRAALAVAERLGTEAVIFPSHHGGFTASRAIRTRSPPPFAGSSRTSADRGPPPGSSMLILAIHETPSVAQERYEEVVRRLTGKNRIDSPSDLPFDGLLLTQRDRGRTVSACSTSSSQRRRRSACAAVLSSAHGDVRRHPVRFHRLRRGVPGIPRA